MLEALLSLDESITLAINGTHSPSADQLMSIISLKQTWLPLYLGLMILVNKVFGWRQGLVIVVAIVLNLVITDQVSVLFKEGIMRLRPCHNPALEGLLHLADGCGGTYGFFSSHAANTMGLAMLIILVFQNQWLNIGMLAFALLNGYSRIYLGKHYALDVLCGFALGILSAYVVYRLTNYVVRRFQIS